jgi:predicted amidohydrolase
MHPDDRVEAVFGPEDGGTHRYNTSIIVDKSGAIVAQCHTPGDELVVADCDLDDCVFDHETIFNVAAHRRIEHYGLITERTGAVPPE